MAHAVAGSTVRRIESLFEDCSVTGLSDRQRLERFARVVLLSLAAMATGAGFLTNSLAMGKNEPKRLPGG
jgi:hypothetical protein